jgi:uncharacterized protein YfaS (alpha-2-macroglobulin family)
MKIRFRARFVDFGKIRVLSCLLASIVAALSQSAPDPEYPANKAAAEKSYAEGSYARAHDIYTKIAPASLAGNEARWVAFRVADTQWRSATGTANIDTSLLDEARTDLEKQIRDLTRDDQHDRIWAEVQESLGDYFWTRRNSYNSYNNWNSAWPHYQAVLDWWAGQSDLALARGRYLNLVWHISQSPFNSGFYFYAYGNPIPLDIFENAAKIAVTDDDQAHAHYLIASTLRNQGGGWEQTMRVPAEFEAAIQCGKKTDWYDDALFNYAEWMEQTGQVTADKNGGWSSHPDYVKALALFRQLTSTYAKGESRYWDQARNEIENITGPQVNVRIGNVFLPGSEIQYYLDWRNVKQVRLALYPVDLTRAVNFPAESPAQLDWLQSIDLTTLKPVRSWTRATPDTGDYTPSNTLVRLDGKLKPGAYLLEASGGGKSSRDLVLVTDAALVLKNSGRQALVYFCNALDSAPIAGAPVQLWESWWADGRWRTRSYQGTTDTNGIFVTQLDQQPDFSMALFASARRDDRQAFMTGNSYWQPQNAGAWHIYAFTDRPAYRPKETASWKFIARRRDNSAYVTPAQETIEYEIADPRGTKIKSDKITLNEFGSAWGSLELTDKMPLGEYRVRFWDEGRHNAIGDAMLFRLEEYKLPEFKVSVTTPEADGRKKTFRLGDTVEAAIQADYYFGGPVANAEVEVLVHQKPYWHFWHEPRLYPWFYSDLDTGQPNGRWGWYGGDQIITNATLKTDATGKAMLRFATPQNTGQDYEYDIEARVTDASRREITGQGTVRVTRQSYYVNASPAHNLYRPQDKVTVNFKALDANDQPVQSEGTVKITRDYWYEIWLAPDGQEVKGGELKRLEAANPVWPPAATRSDQKPWRLKFRGYGQDDILTQSSKTDTNGETEISFTPDREGYYRIAWSGVDAETNRPPQPINGDTTVWVARNHTTDLGYRTGGVEIIADRDTFHVGGTTPVMLVTTTPDRYVLLTVEGGDLYHYELVHVDGTVKLVSLPVVEKYVPNMFLGATLVSDRQIFTDTKQIVVPPVKNFLAVEVKSDQEQYQPRDVGTFTITTRDDAGKPVPAEVALSLVDESVFYIQNDYAGDPRQFFYGTKRAQQIQTQATMNQKSYVKLVEWENDQLIDDQEKTHLEETRREQLDQMLYGGSVGGGGGGFNETYKNGAVLDDMEKDRFVTRYKMTTLDGADVNTGLPAAEQPEGSAGTLTFGGAAVSGEMTRAKLPEGRFPASMPPAAGAEPAVVVRSDFRSTAFWQPDVHTDDHGEATVKVNFPDSLTSWTATARAVTAANQFGIAEAATRTRQPLIVRLEAPRFFVVGDTVTISAVMNNNTENEMTVQPDLELGGVLANTKLEPAVPVTVPANGESRTDWVLKISQPGDVKLKVSVRGQQHADAMEKAFTAYEHGIEKFIANSGKTRSDDTTVQLILPHDRKTGSTSLTVQVTPSLAVTMLDALPYLINYPYGCTEQTLSRFVPTVITAKTLRDLGLRPEDVMGRVFGGIETNTAAATHPQGRENLADMNKMTQAGLDRLADFQHGDGGWGWWKEGDSDHWMTAYVVWGMSLAQAAGVEIKDGVLPRGVKYLDEHLVEEKDHDDMQAFMLHALATYAASLKNVAGSVPNKFQTAAFDRLWKNRDQLNAYTRALLALSAHDYGFADQAKILVENLENGVIRDDRPDLSVLTGNLPSNTNTPAATVMGTAHWGNDGIYWHWSDSGVEATAFALRALLAIDPTNRLVEPVANWLIKNRRGAQWNNTRDTAMAVLALNDYLRVSGELKTDTEFKIYVNGTEVAHREIGGVDVFNEPSQCDIDPTLIQDTNEIRIERVSGGGPLYFSANAKFFSTEEPVAPAGNEMFVKREYYQLAGRPTLLKGYVYDREPLRDGDTVKSGERVETVLTVEAKNDYDYLLFEDLKPAGFEAVEIRSGENVYARQLKAGAVTRRFGATSSHEIKAGETLSALAQAAGVSVAEIEAANPGIDPKRLQIGAELAIPATPSSEDESDYTGDTRWVYQELRDRQVALFIDHLPQGIWEIRYDFRAETPGQFHALPVVGRAMYVPEIRCNSAEIRVNVEDKTP